MLACDCKGAVDTVTAILNGATVNSTWSSYDILILIKHQLDISSIKWTMRHVGGHMDDEKDWKDLDIWEQTNVRADTMAKEALQNWVDSGRQRKVLHEYLAPLGRFPFQAKQLHRKSETKYTTSYGHHKFRNTGVNGCILNMTRVTSSNRSLLGRQ